MLNRILILNLILLLVCASKADRVWGTFDIANIWICPNPKDIDLKEKTDPLIFQAKLPYTLQNGPYEKWCIKKYCPEAKPYIPGVRYNTMFDYTLTDSSIMMPLRNIRTEYVKGLIGFRTEMEWTYNKPNYTDPDPERNSRLNSHWCVFYNQNDCYYGGTEFGFCFRNRNRIEFYNGCSYENVKNLTSELREKVKYPVGYIPNNGLNYVNLTAITTESGFLITVSTSRDNYQSIQTNSTLVPFPACHDEFRQIPGRITASADINLNIYAQDKINYKRIDYVYDTQFIEN